MQDQQAYKCTTRSPSGLPSEECIWGNIGFLHGCSVMNSLYFTSICEAVTGIERISNSHAFHATRSVAKNENAASPSWPRLAMFLL